MVPTAGISARARGVGSGACSSAGVWGVRERRRVVGERGFLERAGNNCDYPELMDSCEDTHEEAVILTLGWVGKSGVQSA